MRSLQVDSKAGAPSVGLQTSTLQSLLASVSALANKHAVDIRSLAIAPAPEVASTATVVKLHARADYAQAKAWLSALTQEVPAMGIQNLAFARADAGKAVDVHVQLLVPVGR